jgi:uncharacterized protein
VGLARHDPLLTGRRGARQIPRLHPPEELSAILRDLDAAAKLASTAANGGEAPAPLEALSWIAALGAAKLDDFYDPDQGSWGARQKAPLGENVAFELRRAAHGDAEARARALFTLDKQRALIDPVWGGVYQYSAATDWASPHYEKLMPYQAANLDAYARAYAMTRDVRLLADARRIAGYMETFLSNPDGAFLVSQDADVGAHDEGAFFVDGDVYYRKDAEGRRKLGLPRVDAHVYPKTRAPPASSPAASARSCPTSLPRASSPRSPARRGTRATASAAAVSSPPC